MLVLLGEVAYKISDPYDHSGRIRVPGSGGGGGRGGGAGLQIQILAWGEDQSPLDHGNLTIKNVTSARGLWG